MRYILCLVGTLLAIVSLGGGAVVQRRYRNAQEVLVPVTVIQDGEVIPEILKPLADIKTIDENVAQSVEEAQKTLQEAEIAVEAQRRIDNDILEDEIKEVVEEENKELLKALEEKKQVLVEEVKEKEIPPAATEEFVILSDIVPDVKEIIKTEQEVEQLKSLIEKDNVEEVAAPLVAEDLKQEEVVAGGSVRQATQATPSQTSTQQNFVQQLIQNSPLGQFFNQISGQTTQTQVASDEAPATPSPTIPGFLAPAITAAQNVVNTTTSAFQGLQQFASNLGNQFQSTLSGLAGQQPAQQSAADGTTARPAGPFQQLVNTFIGANNNPQGTPAPQQGPLQGLLNIFQGNNNNNGNRPQTNNAAAANIAQPEPAKQPEVTAQTNQATEEAAEVVTDDMSNDIRSSAEVEDSFEEIVQPEEMIIVQDEARQSLSHSDQV